MVATEAALSTGRTITLLQPRLDGLAGALWAVYHTRLSASNRFCGE